MMGVGAKRALGLYRAPRQLAGGIWSIITMQYFYEEGQKGSPFIIDELNPIQMPNMDMDETVRREASVYRGTVD